jgi:hypothetical protein
MAGAFHFSVSVRVGYSPPLLYPDLSSNKVWFRIQTDA